MSKKQIIKLITFIVVFLILLSSFQVSSYATVETGTVNFVAIESETNENISNLSVDIYQIGVKNEEGNFEYSARFENSNLDIDTFTDENINSIKEYAIQNAEAFATKTTDSNGEFVVAGLQEGAYLFVQVSETDTYTMQTMFVQVPEIDEQGNSNYIINVEPKITVVPEEPVDTSTPSSNEDVLPYTGVLNWPIPVLVVVALVLFCIGWLKLYTNSKKKVS